MAQAFVLGREFIGANPCALILGDNLFYGAGLKTLLHSANSQAAGATIFAYNVSDPERFGVVEFDSSQRAISIEEKPKNPRSSFAVTGLYFYDNDVVEVADSLQPSARGELEITDVNQYYLNNNLLNVHVMGRGFSWLDTGTHDSLLEAGSFISTIQNRQGLQVACLEEIAFRSGWISANELAALASQMDKTKYGQYLVSLSSAVV